MRKGPAEIMSMGTSQKRESGFCSRVAAIVLDERLAKRQVIVYRSKKVVQFGRLVKSRFPSVSD
jgi:hypothetical protein